MILPAMPKNTSAGETASTPTKMPDLIPARERGAILVPRNLRRDLKRVIDRFDREPIHKSELSVTV